MILAVDLLLYLHLSEKLSVFQLEFPAAGVLHFCRKMAGRRYLVLMILYGADVMVWLCTDVRFFFKNFFHNFLFDITDYNNIVELYNGVHKKITINSSPLSHQFSTGRKAAIKAYHSAAQNFSRPWTWVVEKSEGSDQTKVQQSAQQGRKGKAWAREEGLRSQEYWPSSVPEGYSSDVEIQ